MKTMKFINVIIMVEGEPMNARRGHL